MIIISDESHDVVVAMTQCALDWYHDWRKTLPGVKKSPIPHKLNMGELKDSVEDCALFPIARRAVNLFDKCSIRPIPLNSNMSAKSVYRELHNLESSIRRVLGNLNLDFDTTELDSLYWKICDCIDYYTLIYPYGTKLNKRLING